MEDMIRVIEVNGIKMEIDLRNAKKIENYKVGDTVKILKEKYSNDYRSHLGVIVGFDEFEKHPTIVVAYLDIEYSDVTIRFAYINSVSKDVEMCPINEWDIPFSKQDILDKVDREIEKKSQELAEIKSKRSVFLTMFGKYFEKSSGITNDSNNAF
jgi:hypothetical protein